MPLINKANVNSTLQTTLDGLTVSTEDTKRLLFLLETARNAGQYSANVVNELLTRISTVTTSNTVTDVSLLIKSGELIHFDRQFSTANLTTLNAFTDAIVGTAIYVDSEYAPYIRKSDGTWKLIDAVLQPAQVKNAWAWGDNARGRLGTGNTSNRSSPVSVVGGFTDWIFLESGYSNSLGLRANGTLWSWGVNDYGKLGDGTTTDRSSPVSVIGGFTDWVSCITGGYHSVGIRANGLMYAWGNNGRGQLGSGTIADRRSSPTLVSGGITDWIQASSGHVHTLALRANGTLWGFGRNNTGQNGDGTATQRSSPVSVVGGFTDWVFVDAGGYHSLGIRANGVAYGWGYGNNGRLGDGTTVGKSSPVSVVGGFTDWIQVSGGWYHSMGLRANGTLWAWGANYLGQLGTNNTAGTVSSPVSVVGGFTDWVSVSGGRRHSIGLRANGTLWTWGNNGSGQLGTNSATNTSSPVSVVGGFTDWIQSSMSSHATHTLGLRGG